MKSAYAALAVLALTVAGTVPAHAATVVFSGVMSGLNEAPANASGATGSFTAVLDDVANSLVVDLSFSGLSSSASSGILHCCAPAGANAGSILTLTGFPSAISGSYSRTLFGLTNADVTAIKGGLSYINIHTFAFPAGEIRGAVGVARDGIGPRAGDLDIDAPRLERDWLRHASQGPPDAAWQRGAQSEVVRRPLVAVRTGFGKGRYSTVDIHPSEPLAPALGLI